MRKLAVSLVALLTVASLALAGGKLHKGGSKAKAFTGEIMDSQCAMMGSHDPAGYKMTNTTTPKDCTLKCVGMGGKFTLYDAAKKITYQLDDQDKPKEFAGQKVTVTGTYDKATKTIHVEKIEAAS
jgi:hypothetical protein